MPRYSIAELGINLPFALDEITTFQEPTDQIDRSAYIFVNPMNDDEKRLFTALQMVRELAKNEVSTTVLAELNKKIQLLEDLLDVMVRDNHGLWGFDTKILYCVGFQVVIQYRGY